CSLLPPELGGCLYRGAPARSSIAAGWRPGPDWRPKLRESQRTAWSRAPGGARSGGRRDGRVMAPGGGREITSLPRRREARRILRRARQVQSVLDVDEVALVGATRDRLGVGVVLRLV